MNAIGYIVGVSMIVGLILLPSYELFKHAYIKLKTVYVISDNVTGEVIKKEHVNSHSCGGESYLVLVKCNGIEQLIDNKDIYSRYRVGDQIKLILTKKYDKNKVLLEQVLEPRS